VTVCDGKQVAHQGACQAAIARLLCLPQTVQLLLESV